MRKIPSLAAFAKLENAFDDRAGLIQRLRMEPCESRHLEFKLTPPLGPSVSARTKYRMVKAAISFANTEGGFIIFGVNPSNGWIGFNRSDLADADPAKLYELINSHVGPQIEDLYYDELIYERMIFPVLHLLPSSLMPHVVTKEVKGEHHEIFLAKHALYCRYGGKSDQANPQQFERIINRRVELFKTEMVRRIKQVEVPIIVPSKSTLNNNLPLRITRLTEDESTPAVHITKDPETAAGILVVEELDEQLFSDIDKVLKANTLLSASDESFMFSEEMYYRVYAERDKVHGTPKEFELLAITAFCKFNSIAPLCYWLLQLSPSDIVNVLLRVTENPLSHRMSSLIKILSIFGREALQWLMDEVQPAFAKTPQPPGYYYRLKELLNLRANENWQYKALFSKGPRTSIDLPSITSSYEELMVSPIIAEQELTSACALVFEGKKGLRPVCRELDLISYTRPLKAHENNIVSILNSKQTDLAARLKHVNHLSGTSEQCDD